MQWEKGQIAPASWRQARGPLRHSERRSNTYPQGPWAWGGKGIPAQGIANPKAEAQTTGSFRKLRGLQGDELG